MTAAPRRPWDLVAALVVSALASAHRFANGYVIDDRRMFVDNDIVHHLGNIPRFFANNAMWAASGGDLAVDTYRPMALSSFAVNWAMSGPDPWAFHATNLAMHLGVVLALMIGVAAAGPHGRRAAPWVGAIVGMHPLLAEAHVWINGRSDLFCALPLVLALHVDATAKRAWTRALGVLALVALAGFGKEVAAPAAIVAAVWAASRGSGATDRVARAAPWLLGAAIPLGARMLALDGLDAGGGSDLTAALARLGAFEMHGLGALIAPLRVSMPQLTVIYGDLGPHVIVGGWVLGILGLGLCVLYARTMPRVVFGLIAFGATLAPSVMVTTVDWPGFGRYLYVPTVLLAWGVGPQLGAMAANATPRTRRAAGVVLGLWCAFLAMQTARVTLDYRSPESFYGAITAEWPDHGHGWGGLGEELARQRRYEPAIEALETAVDLAPHHGGYLQNLGFAYVFTGRNDAAVRVAERGIAADPTREPFYVIGGLALMNVDPEASAAFWVACLRDAAQVAGCADNTVRLATQHPLAPQYVEALRRAAADPVNVGVGWPAPLAGALTGASAP